MSSNNISENNESCKKRKIEIMTPHLITLCTICFYSQYITNSEDQLKYDEHKNTLRHKAYILGMPSLCEKIIIPFTN